MSNNPLRDRLHRFCKENKTGIVLQASSTDYIVGAEWGEEASDSPMAGAASYGRGSTIEDAVNQLLEQARY